LPTRQPDLRDQAAEFARRTSDLLNRTVANGVRIRVVLREDSQLGWAGYEIDRRRPFPGRGIPLTLTAAAPRCYLHVMHTLVQRYGVLVTDRSSFGLYLDEQLDRNVFHYDYARDPSNPYPVAHLQVDATSAAFNELCGRVNRDAELGRLHFPVGGKRFRPCLEDLVEMLVVEGLVSSRDGWQAATTEHRAWFHRIQLKAAVRDDPDAAREELRRLEDLQAQQPPVGRPQPGRWRPSRRGGRHSHS